MEKEGSAEGNKKPSVPKCMEGSQKLLLGNSASSLAVFYVEQVALNRHVSRPEKECRPAATAAELYMAENGAFVNRN
jgi:hypothetical protein